MRAGLLVHMHRSAQRGATLVFSMITLVALSLAAVALIRSVDGGTLILGNLGFKQDSQAAADDAARSAIKWLTDNVSNVLLHTDSTTNGYYASIRSNLDVTGNDTGNASRVLIDWDMNSCAGHANCLAPVSTELSLMGGKVTARYLIMRLCDGTGDPNATTRHCARAIPSGTSGGGGTKGGSCFGYPATCVTTTTLPGIYYRILVRAKGGRETTTFTETLVHF